MKKKATRRSSSNAPAASPAEIRPEQSLPLLQALHILTRDGKLNQDSRRKLKQVYHLIQFIEPMITECLSQPTASFDLVDHGAGKSYLGFLLYDLVLKNHHHAHVHGIEARPELVEKSVALANELGFERMHFHPLKIDESMTATTLPCSIDMVTALHACDTATDDAIRFALAKRATYIVLVPCCQAEVATTWRQNKSQTLGMTALSELWRRPLHTREFASHVTNILRCLLLEAHGYQVKVTELVGWEHSIKNELVIARYTGQRRGNARERTQQILSQLGLEALSERFIYPMAK